MFDVCMKEAYIKSLITETNEAHQEVALQRVTNHREVMTTTILRIVLTADNKMQTITTISMTQESTLRRISMAIASYKTLLKR